MAKAKSGRGAPAGDTDFDWISARDLLAGLPGGGLNIAHETADRHVAEGHANRPALVSLGRRYERRQLSYGELAEQSGRVGAALAGLGVAKGEVVAVLLDRGLEFFLAALGAWKAGAVFCPLFSAFGPGPLKSRLELSRARVVITTVALYQRKMATIRAALPDLTHVITIGEPGETPAGCHDFATLVSKVLPMDAVATAETDSALLHFTSGTTGTPKGVIHSHRTVLSLLVSARQVFELSPDDVYWCTADPGWVTCSCYGIIAPLAVGCLSVIDEAEFDTRRWYGVLKDEKVTVWYTTPTNIRMMMRFGAALARSYRQNSLRVAASVGEPLNREAVAWGEKALGVPFLDTWWQTETGAIAIANRTGCAQPGSMGRPLPGVQAAVAIAKDGKLHFSNDAEAVGELAIRATLPSLFSGYLNDPARTEASFADGWYLTGDQVRLGANGCVWFIGRIDDMIKSAAHTIGPFEIECALMNHPAVGETGVVGKPDLLLREVPVAFVSVNPGFEAGDSLRLELLSFARHELGTAMAPREVHFLETLPKTTTGKILRRALKAKAVAEPEEDDPAPLPYPGRFDDE
jgi:acetyl-CoA synthetase